MTIPQIKSAKDAFKAAAQRSVDGNLSEIARRCGVSPQAVQAWSTTGIIPARRVVQLCDALDGNVDEHQLRPDVFRPGERRSGK